MRAPGRGGVLVHAVVLWTLLYRSAVLGRLSAQQGSLHSPEQLVVLLWRDGAALLPTSNSP